ncbi:MAG: CHAP domain-containing protein [Nitrospirae bacterium]|nr:CHAP domain-containing protein [Nitrospirota bacterium]
MKGLKVRGWEVIAIAIFIVMAMAATAMATDTYHRDYYSNCPKGADVVENGRNGTQNRGWYTCECTSYAAEKMFEHGVKLTDSYKGVTWGDPFQWISAIDKLNKAGDKSVTYNKSPKHMDIAVWTNIGPTDTRYNHKTGHVAYVESVDGSGNITVSEYNYSTSHQYDKDKSGNDTLRAISKGSSSYPDYFIHFGAK